MRAARHGRIGSHAGLAVKAGDTPSLAQHGVQPTNTAELLELDVELNAQGIAAWLDRASKKSAKAG